MTAEELVKQVLEENFHLNVEKIPECESKTPDYFAYNDTEKYLVEVKEKESNPDIKREHEEVLTNGELYEISQTIQPKTVLGNIVRSGKQQIEEFVKDEDTFRIIWIHCSGLAYEATREQIINGLYGAETLVDWGNEQAISGICFYFNESHFFRYRNDIDAVVISCRNSEVKICLNDHSPRYEELRESSLVSNFKQAVCDPIADEADGIAFIVDAPIDRKVKGAVLAYLKDKYQTEKLMVMPMHHFEAHFAVPHNEI